LPIDEALVRGIRREIMEFFSPLGEALVRGILKRIHFFLKGDKYYEN